MGSRWILCGAGMRVPLRLSGWVSRGLQRPLPQQKDPLLETPPAAAPAPQTDGPVPWCPPPGSGDYCEPATLGSSVWQLRTPMLFAQWFWGLRGAGKHRCGGPQDRWDFPKGAEEAPAEGPREHTQVQQMA